MMHLPVVRQILDAVKMKEKIVRYKKPIIITTFVILLQLIFGFEPKFCIINIIWLFV